MTIFGTAKIYGKNTLQLRLGNQNEFTDFEIIFHAGSLKFITSALPDALNLFTAYTARIYFNNPTKFTPKFSYNFPVEFGRVDNTDNGIDFTEIKFSPSRAGKYKFFVQAIGPYPENILLAEKTIHMEVIDSNLKNVQAENVFGNAKAIDINDWK